ncbi:MAG TPA: hypothetical protein VH062_12965 [Polyangiaceae bacterium]|jgi:hypothetical protein|nr:hypothetical protein [Polyangiaceae bacterium]
MKIAEPAPLDGDSVSYEGAPVAEVQVEDLEYRVDAGLGSIVAISRRVAGTSTWAPVAQGKWDGVRLRAKALDHPIVSSLERALVQAMADRDERSSWG